MKVNNPQDMNEAFTEAFNSGEIAQLMQLYEDDAILAPTPGQRAVGKQAIREGFGTLMALKAKIFVKNNYCMRSGNIALLQGEWKLSFIDQSGEKVEQAAKSAEVVRQQADGSWLYIIDHPYFND